MSAEASERVWVLETCSEGEDWWPISTSRDAASVATALAAAEQTPGRRYRISVGPRPSLQAELALWARRVLGEAAFLNGEERGLRVVEEAVELAQALGTRREELHQLIDYVYARPAGVAAQEIGGVLVTAYVAAASCGVDADAARDAEVLRIHTPDVEARVRRRQNEKRALRSEKPPCQT